MSSVSVAVFVCEHDATDLLQGVVRRLVDVITMYMGVWALYIVSQTQIKSTCKKDLRISEKTKALSEMKTRTVNSMVCYGFYYFSKLL